MMILAIQPYADGAGHYGKYAVRISQDISRQGHQVVLCINHIDLHRNLDAPIQDALAWYGILIAIERSLEIFLPALLVVRPNPEQLVRPAGCGLAGQEGKILHGPIIQLRTRHYVDVPVCFRL